MPRPCKKRGKGNPFFRKKRMLKEPYVKRLSRHNGVQFLFSPGTFNFSFFTDYGMDSQFFYVKCRITKYFDSWQTFPSLISFRILSLFLTVQLSYPFLPAGVSTVDFRAVNVPVHLPHHPFCGVPSCLLIRPLHWHHISLPMNKPGCKKHHALLPYSYNHGYG